MKDLKFTFLITFLLALFTFSSWAQVDEMEAQMSLGDKNALVVDIQNVDKKQLESFFKDYFREYGKVKYNRKASEYYITEAELKPVSNDKVDVYAKMEDLNKAARLMVWIDNGTGFLNSTDHEKAYDAAAGMLVDFDIYVEKSLIEEELKDAERALDKMERDARQLEKDEEKYKETIEDAKKKITEMQEALVENERAQDDKSSEIKIHKEAIEEIREKLNNVGKNKKVKM
ncbi:hypothetical protein [Portibacter marinus]|uniref:hypothetical protein n=1 Tax=Portibacter marinus TaxID=2898660 RepID=UPI001F2DF2A7|nr:hypothetical protein [Portibacter marinus]